MSETPTRLPSPWWVVVPALLLALLGARAVVMEAERAETASRGQGRAAAARLARTVETMIAEFEQALPDQEGPWSVARALDATDFLEPRWLVAAGGRSLEPDRVAARASDAERALEQDALATAEKLGEAGEGAEAAAALLAGAAAAVESPRVRTRLALAAAVRETSAGRAREAALDLGVAAEAAGRLSLADEGATLVLVLETATVLLEEDRRWVANAPWLHDVAERVAADPFGLGERRRDALLDGVDAGSVAAARALWDSRRALAGAAVLPRAIVSSAAGEVSVEVFRRIQVEVAGATVDAVVGGRVPGATVQHRLHQEAQALVAEGGVHAIRMLGPGGVEVLTATGEAPAGRAPLIESVPLSAPLAGWTVRAESSPAAGVSGFAVLLGIAGLISTLALLGGALALTRAAARQARLADERKRFLDHVAHEIRTPATALLTLSEQLASGRVDAKREPEYRRHLLAEARRLADLVDDTLDLTRLESGGLAFRREPVDLRDVVQDAVTASRARKEPSPGAPDVALAVPESSVNAGADRSAVARALRNLVDNARHHGGGDRPVEVTLATTAAHAVITVRDHGRGIAPEHVAHVFERFYRVPEATHETKGVGLGLSLVHEVIAGHGGTVTCESTPGAGTSFEVRLPLETRHG